LYIVGATSSRLLAFNLKLPVLSTESALELQFAINLTTFGATDETLSKSYFQQLLSQEN
jgi:hypothetical protein